MNKDPEAMQGPEFGGVKISSLWQKAKNGVTAEKPSP